MRKLQFKCKLLTDVIINQKAATEGNQETLDFIPGSNFLGIVASDLYREDKLSALELGLLFHSGAVRFGDAHPAFDNIRSLRVPTQMFHPKGVKETEELYIHFAIPDLKELSLKQLKQSRKGFYAFSQEQGVAVTVNKSFSIKSAYDRRRRCSQDEKMYGYQSIEKGLELFFEVELIEPNVFDFESNIIDALVGVRRIGRSRTAQYGLVEIEKYSYKEVESLPSEDGIVTVYADGRLIFLDKNGCLTFEPSVEQLGFPKGSEILFEKSQIRTFQYSPWNYKRQCRDTDRCGIEKGSVFVVRTDHSFFSTSKYIGSYKNEGFGKVIYNPSFLQADSAGKAICKLKDSPVLIDSFVHCSQSNSTPLFRYLIHQKECLEDDQKVYELVNLFVEKNKSLFEREAFASQWGSIRNIALQCNTEEALRKALFDGDHAYLNHGVAKSKWQERGRLKRLIDFFNENKSSVNVQNLLVNLASEMAKPVKRN